MSLHRRVNASADSFRAPQKPRTTRRMPCLRRPTPDARTYPGPDQTVAAATGATVSLLKEARYALGVRARRRWMALPRAWLCRR
ncbi:hypothetical protein [Streptomyces sp. NBC_00057]|uniref:hypothetical protein n=1 Tax=Streptomyces sp. NBC_00057 TaxID=2975634 RepID=UPI003252BB05